MLRLREIKTGLLQEVIDACPHGSSTKKEHQDNPAFRI